MLEMLPFLEGTWHCRRADTRKRAFRPCCKRDAAGLFFFDRV